MTPYEYVHTLGTYAHIIKRIKHHTWPALHDPNCFVQSHRQSKASTQKQQRQRDVVGCQVVTSRSFRWLVRTLQQHDRRRLMMIFTVSVTHPHFLGLLYPCSSKSGNATKLLYTSKYIRARVYEYHDTPSHDIPLCL